MALRPSSRDLPDGEIERRYRVALADIRRGGTGDVARRDDAPSQPVVYTRDVFRALHEHPQTVREIAIALQQPLVKVWGHVSFLRKQGKVKVHAWITSQKGRRMAVYEVVR